VLLSLQRLNRMRAIDDANLTLTAEAGCVLQAAQQAAAERGLLLPLSLAAEGSCTIGGNLATNAGGTQVLRWGNARELCLGLEVVTAAGRGLGRPERLRKDNTGYDLRDLFIGSEGTLGIITAATLKLAPQPAASTTALAPAPRWTQCVALLALARRRLGAGLTGFEVMGRFALAWWRGTSPPCRAAARRALDGAAGAERHEGEAHARALSRPAGRRAGSRRRARRRGGREPGAVAALWHLRESIPLAQAEEGLNIKHDISLPVSAIPGFVRPPTPRCSAPFPACGWSTSATWATATCTTTCRHRRAPTAAFLADARAAVNTWSSTPWARGGSFSAEHGIGALKRDELARASRRWRCADARHQGRAGPAGPDEPGARAVAPRVWTTATAPVPPADAASAATSLDALFVQRLALVGSGLAADPALRRLAVVDAARLLGKARADVLGVLDQVAHRLQPRGLQVGGHGWRRSGGGRRRHLGSGHSRLAGAGKVQPRRAGQPRDDTIDAQRALDRLAAVLLEELILGTEPAFETVAIGAAQVEHLHLAIIASGCQCSTRRPLRHCASHSRPTSVLTSVISPRAAMASSSSSWWRTSSMNSPGSSCARPAVRPRAKTRCR
jgi:FAD/FMN-containing dehydrogenase